MSTELRCNFKHINHKRHNVYIFNHMHYNVYIVQELIRDYSKTDLWKMSTEISDIRKPYKFALCSLEATWHAPLMCIFFFYLKQNSVSVACYKTDVSGINSNRTLPRLSFSLTLHMCVSEILIRWWIVIVNSSLSFFNCSIITCSYINS